MASVAAVSQEESFIHLVVGVHGLHGDPGNVHQLLTAIATAAEPSDVEHALLDRCRRRGPTFIIQTHASTANHGILSSLLSTSQGIDIGGELLALELVQLLSASPRIRALSIVGVSLGGLFARAALAYEPLRSLMTSNGVRPVNFITFATPHAGVRQSLSPLLHTALSAGVLGTTGIQLLLQDASVEVPDSDLKLPVLVWMSHPHSPHIAALRAFQSRVLVSCAEGDDRVPFYSSALCPSLRCMARAGEVHSTVIQCVYARSDLGASAVHVCNHCSNAFPHVVSVYEQRGVDDTCITGGGDEEAMTRIPGPHTHAIAALYPAHASAEAEDDGSAQVGDAKEPHTDLLRDTACLEEYMARNLRAYAGGWVNVHARFTEFGRVLDHLRIAVTHPRVASAGMDVLAFVAQRVFVYE